MFALQNFHERVSSSNPGRFGVGSEYLRKTPASFVWCFEANFGWIVQWCPMAHFYMYHFVVHIYHIYIYIIYIYIIYISICTYKILYVPILIYPFQVVGFFTLPAMFLGTSQVPRTAISTTCQLGTRRTWDRRRLPWGHFKCHGEWWVPFFDPP